MPTYLQIDKECQVRNYYTADTPIADNHVELPNDFDLRTVDIHLNDDGIPVFTSNVTKQEMLFAHEIGYLRSKRNKLLQETDWTINNDSPLSQEKIEEWKVYRQALRDLPANTTDPENPVWPQAPTP